MQTSASQSLVGCKSFSLQIIPLISLSLFTFLVSVRTFLTHLHYYFVYFQYFT